MSKKRGFFFRILKLIIFIVVLMGAIYLFREQIIRLLQINPTVWAIFSHISDQVVNRTLLGLFYATFFGGLFFVTIPLEVIFVIYLNLDYDPFLVALIALTGNLLGLMADYAIGRVVGEKVLIYFLKESYDKFQRWINKAGIAIILIGNIIPFPIQLISVVLGATKYQFKKFVIFTIIGKISMFYLIYSAQGYFIEEVIPQIQKLI